MLTLGWAFGQNTTTNQKGAFPMACLNVRLSHDASEDPKKIRLRMSSLYNGTGMHPPPI